MISYGRKQHLSTNINIVRNPFASEAQDDINLMQKLDINIWKGSVAIKNIHEPPLAVEKDGTVSLNGCLAMWRMASKEMFSHKQEVG